jgi:hypothetical protein
MGRLIPILPAMNRLRLLLLAALVLTGASNIEAAPPRILKVLPHLLDQEGRHTLSPSLYERDAYQAHLRKNPNQISAIRFDIQWKASARKNLKMRVEIRGTRDPRVSSKVLEETVKSGRWFSTWTGITLNRDALREVGEMAAWRVTLWEDGQQIAEQKSFLWQ